MHPTALGHALHYGRRCSRVHLPDRWGRAGEDGKRGGRGQGEQGGGEARSPEDVCRLVGRHLKREGGREGGLGSGLGGGREG